MAHHCMTCGTRIPSSDWHCECPDCRKLSDAEKLAIATLKEERYEQERAGLPNYE